MANKRSRKRGKVSRGSSFRRQGPVFDVEGDRVARIAGSFGFSPELWEAFGDACLEAGCSGRLLVTVAVAKFLGVKIDDAV